MRHTKSHRFFLSAIHSLLGVAAALLLTYGAYRLQLDLTSATFLCLIVVLLVALGGSFIPAAFVSIVALLCVNHFFIPPLLSVRAASPMDEIAVIAFLNHRTGHQPSGGQAASSRTARCRD
jgi:K+-sensing histidine kinase KdpD